MRLKQRIEVLEYRLLGGQSSGKGRPTGRLTLDGRETGLPENDRLGRNRRDRKADEGGRKEKSAHELSGYSVHHGRIKQRLHMRAALLYALAAACALSTKSASIPACKNDQLSASIHRQGVGMSHWAEAIEFLNKSAKSCRLSGVPRVDLIKADGQRFPIPECVGCAAYLFPAFPIRPTVLNPGGKAHVLMESVTGYDKPFCNTTEYDRIAWHSGNRRSS